jgi:hypothetical protein
MDADVKRQIDLRLAKGEISKEEYLSALHTLTQNAGDGQFSLSSLLSKAKEFLAPAAYQIVIPTDESPLVVNDEFCLYSSFFVNSGRQVSYSEIIALACAGRKEYVNGALTTYSLTFRIWLNSGDSIYVSASKEPFKNARNVMLAENAFQFLSKITFTQRLQRKLRQFETQGFIFLGGLEQDVRLFPNGDIQQGDLRINLREAHRKNMVRFGTNAIVWKDPNTVVIGESGTTMFSRRIVFSLRADRDVESALILGLARGETI